MGSLENPTHQPYEIRNTRTGFEIHAQGGGYVSCRLKEQETGKLVAIDYSEVPEDLRGHGRGTVLYDKAIREAVARGATSLFVAFENPSALRNHLRLFGEDVSKFREVIGNKETDLGNASGEDAQRALINALPMRGSLYTEVDLTDPRVRERLGLPQPHSPGNSQIDPKK